MATKKKAKKPGRRLRERCEWCDKLFPVGELSYGPDPYENDINDDDTPVWLCLPCAEDSAADI